MAGNMSNLTFCEQESRKATASHIMLYERVIYAGIVGFAIAFVGIVVNTFLLIAALAKVSAIFVKTLAICDIGMCLAYIFVISLVMTAEYLQNEVLLYICYRILIRPMFFFGNFVKVGQLYIILAASVDRLLTVRAESERRKIKVPQCTNKARLLIAYILVGLAFLIKLPTFFEISIVSNPECSGFGYIYPDMGSIFHSHEYVWFKRYPNPIIHVYLPFITLIILNILILKAMSVKGYNSSALTLVLASQNASCRKRKLLAKKRKLKEATYTLIVITTGYLVANVVSVTVSLIEHVNSMWLYQHYLFYTVSSDVASLLVILVCSSRPLIYCAINTEMRKHFSDALTNRKRRVTQRLSKSFESLLSVRNGSLISERNGDVDNNNVIIQKPSPVIAILPPTEPEKTSLSTDSLSDEVHYV